MNERMMTSSDRAVRASVGYHVWCCTMLCVSLLLTACQSSSRSLPTVEVAFVSDAGTSSPSFAVEVVADQGDRSQGLMYRKHLESDKGMLFVFPHEAVQSFWMKNTYIPLDMVFVSRDFEVVGALENIPPLTETPRRVNRPSLYVLEFAAGTAKKFAITEGVKLTVKGDIPEGR